MWVCPSFSQGSILVQQSTKFNGQDWCSNLIGFSSNGQLIVTLWNGSIKEILGPILSVNVWTHVVYSYSSSNGLRLFINGTLINSSGPQSYVGSGEVNTLILANSIRNDSCHTQSIVNNVYFGSLDELRVYSRELNSTDIYNLVNP